METAAIIELVSTLGFPIAAVVALAIFIFRIYKKSEQREDVLMEEVKHTREVNAQAIETIAHYAEKLDTIQSDIKDIKTDITIIMAKDGGN
jgi:chromosome segregation ATPase